MLNSEFKILKEQLDRIEALVMNFQPKKRPHQTKISDERKLEDQMRQYQDLYAPSLMREFWLYWTEKTVSGKERWQMEKVFDVAKRLEKWKRNQDRWQWEKEQREVLRKVNEKPQQRLQAD